MTPQVARIDDPTMKRFNAALVVLGLAFVAGCDRDRGTSVPAVDGRRLHGHPMADAAVRTSIGQVRAIDADGRTLTVVLAKGRSREHSGRGATLALDATPAQLGRVRVGEVVEFKWRAPQPRARLVSIDAHGHGDAAASIRAPPAARYPD